MKTTHLLSCLAFAALPLLAGCGHSGPLTPQEECDRAAYDDPEVKTANANFAASSPNYQQDHLREVQEMARQASLRCMRAKGLAPPGGVEAVKRAY